MSEPILKAIIQLLAISASVDGTVTESEKKVTYDFISENLNYDDVPRFQQLFDEYASIALQTQLQIHNIAKKINQELDQKQKVIVLMHLLELVSADGGIHESEEELVDELAQEFNIDSHEYSIIKAFVTNDDVVNLGLSNILIISGKELPQGYNHLFREGFGDLVAVLRIPSMEMYWLKFFQQDHHNTFLNGVVMKDHHIYSFSNGGSIRGEHLSPVYYSDVVVAFLKDAQSTQRISFEAKHITLTFPGGVIGLRDINIAEEGGRLIGLMGASGSGKSTLLNVLNGTATPVEGQVLVNGIDIHDPVDKDRIEGVIGYVPQDDLLIEELTVYQNLYYAAKLCFDSYTAAQIDERVNKILQNLGLFQIRHLKVGNPLQKTISGGQRKRLNIGLELLREPALLFVDEPTSGLSSNDSENILDLLKELSLKGKMVFVVIHQPSSDIFKMFDKLVILDVGGYQIYYGDPIEAITYFRSRAELINSHAAACMTCGNVNPEQIFNIIETKLIDEYGRYTSERKVSPAEWRRLFDEHIEVPEVHTATHLPPSSLDIPSRLKQFWIFGLRDLMSKLGNSQYMSISLGVAPALALILAYIVRYYHIDHDSDTASVYSFYENLNIPAYLFMSIIVALFVGLTVSAEEIIRDAKIRQREAFLHLSRTSYLCSKVGILFGFSALQMLMFVLIGNSILEIKAMGFQYWALLFSTACFANMLGLNISASFKSVVTIYILIPVMLIPQLILGGIVVRFDHVNPHLGSDTKVPWVSELMVSRWAYEAMMVTQFKDNPFQRRLYPLDQTMAMSEYNKVYYVPRLLTKLAYCRTYFSHKTPETRASVANALLLLNNEVNTSQVHVPQLSYPGKLPIDTTTFDLQQAKLLEKYFDDLRKHYIRQYNWASAERDRLVSALVQTPEDRERYLAQMRKYHNKSVAEIVQDLNETNHIAEIDGRLVQKIYPIFQTPARELEDFLAFRTHFFAPQKHFAGLYIDTFWFNLLAIWTMTAVLYLALYYNALQALLSLVEFGKKRR
ncbi:ATP-binding cassette domain-containing protein [Eisenibacter elegans]|jgi:ABC-type multidrug transport system ATPase subunit/uncharacterized tellurite resistance protein B-like protein|uniref:ATP-binding cassette domain-containing protein n=1 Tax=Eisenibacter elegans TaxID=997 RepID=UPI00040D5F64|nr:ATP-binding cassette domain-containing protein [Eisenibacter elegans]